MTKEEVEPYYKQVKEMASELIELHGSIEEYYDKFSEFKKVITVYKYPDRMEWYERIFKVIDDMAQPQPQGPFGHINFKAAHPSAINPHTEYKKAKKERNRLIDDIKVLELQQAEQLKILNDYGKPKWVWSGLFVLVYACGVGIVYPSTLLPYPEKEYDDLLTKWFLLGLFFSQILALIIYLGFATYKLTNEKEDYK